MTSDVKGYFNRIADSLDEVRVRICAYGASESQTCDCKFGIDPTVNLMSSEKTGCPELRKIVRAYRAYAETL